MTQECVGGGWGFLRQYLSLVSRHMCEINFVVSSIYNARFVMSIATYVYFLNFMTHVWGKLCDFIHYNVQFVMFICDMMIWTCRKGSNTYDITAAQYFWLVDHNDWCRWFAISSSPPILPSWFQFQFHGWSCKRKEITKLGCEKLCFSGSRTEQPWEML
jgi:hypothetical protein